MKYVVALVAGMLMAIAVRSAGSSLRESADIARRFAFPAGPLTSQQL